MLTEKNIITQLFENFPDFKRKMNYDVDELLPYNVIGDFALDFQNDYLNLRLTSLEVNKFFNFANQMADSDDKVIQNIFVVEILEILSDKDETIKISQEKLNKNGKYMLQKVLRGWK